MTDATETKIKDLRRGDRVELIDGSIAIIRGVEPIPIIDTSKGAGGAYMVRWSNSRGQVHCDIVAGNHAMDVLGK
jgi:hypothetical protein